MQFVLFFVPIREHVPVRGPESQNIPGQLLETAVGMAHTEQVHSREHEIGQSGRAVRRGGDAASGSAGGRGGNLPNHAEAAVGGGTGSRANQSSRLLSQGSGADESQNQEREWEFERHG